MRSPVPIEHLLQHSRWLRELALRLVGDVHTADDLVQATWLAALASGPHHSENVRGWLGRVVPPDAARITTPSICDPWPMPQNREPLDAAA
jgi:hypothetical protein